MRCTIFLLCLSPMVFADIYIDMQQAHQTKIPLGKTGAQIRLLNLQSPGQYKCTIQDAKIVQPPTGLFPDKASFNVGADGKEFLLKSAHYSSAFNAHNLPLTLAQTNKKAHVATMDCVIDVDDAQTPKPVALKKASTPQAKSSTSKPLSRTQSFMLALDAIHTSLIDALDKSAEHRAATLKQSRGVLKEAQSYMKSKKISRKSKLYQAYSQAKTSYLELKNIKIPKVESSKPRKKDTSVEKVVKVVTKKRKSLAKNYRATFDTIQIPADSAGITTLVTAERELMVLNESINQYVSKKKSRGKAESIKALRKDIDRAIQNIMSKLQPKLHIEVDKALRALSTLELQLSNWDKRKSRAQYEFNSGNFDQELWPLVAYFDGFLPYISDDRLIGNIEVFKDKAQLLRGMIGTKDQFDQVLTSLPLVEVQ